MKNLFLCCLYLMIPVISFCQNSNSQIYNTKGDEYLKNGDTINAISEYSKTIARDPRNYYALKSRGLLNNAGNNYNEAVKDFTVCLSIKQNDADVYYQRGLAKQKLAGDPGALSFIGDPISGKMTLANESDTIWKEVLRDYETAVKLDPDLVDAYFQSAYIKNSRVLEDLGDPIEDWNAILALQPGNSEVLNLRAVYKIQKKEDYQGAEADLIDALKVNPADTIVLQNLLSTEIFLQKYDEAIRYANIYIPLCPKSGIGYFIRGIAKAYLKDFQGCVQDFDEAIKISPTEAAYYLNRGYIRITELNLAQEGCMDLASAKQYGDQQAQGLIDQYCK